MDEPERSVDGAGGAEQPAAGAKAPKRRKMGRRPKSERVDYDEVDKLLVFGELVQKGDGRPTVHYPSYRDIASRFDVAMSLIAAYSKRHNCLNRRELAKDKIESDATSKLAELRANIEAYTRDDELRVIDRYLEGFERALADGRVRFDSPSDLDKVLRLKKFLQGGADSRQEVHASFTLSQLQERHQQAVVAAQAVTVAETGVDEPAAALPPPDDISSAPPSVVIEHDSPDDGASDESLTGEQP